MAVPLIAIGFKLLKLVVSRQALRSISFNVGRVFGFLIPQGVRNAFRTWRGWIMGGMMMWLGERTISEGMSMINEASYTIMQFNWNETDQELRNQIAQNNNQLAQLVGRFAGGGLVRLASVGAAMGAQLKYPVVAGRVAIALAEDTSDQMRNDFIALIEGCRQLVSENAMMSIMLTLRARRMFGLSPVTEDKPSFTFAEAIEQRIERIPNQLLRNFVRGFVEGAEDAFWDVGYIVAGTLDDVVAANRYTQTQQFGRERAIVVTPDVTIPDETIVLAGSQRLVEQNLDTVIAQHKLIRNRDVGSIVAQPIEDYLKARPQLRKLVITFKAKELPPWRGTDGRNVKEAVYSIPDAKPGLTWLEIKTAASAFTWGRFLATAKLNNQRQMQVYGATANEARSKLLELLTLSTAEILKLSVSEEQVVNPALVKRSTQMYPAYASFIGRRNTLDNEGRTVLDGRNFTENIQRILLYTPTEPPGFTRVP